MENILSAVQDVQNAVLGFKDAIDLGVANAKQNVYDYLQAQGIEPGLLIVGFAFVFLVSLPLLWVYILKAGPSTGRRPSADIPQTSPTGEAERNDIYTSIEPLPSFNWKDEEPIQMRPFKPVLHLTMGLETIPFSSLLAMDKTYLSRIQWRRETLASHPTDTVQALPGSKPLVDELYTYLFGTYLPSRFPSIYILIAPQPTEPVAPKSSAPLFLRNRVLDESVPVRPPAAPEAALRLITAHIDTDFLLLDLPGRTSPEMPIPADARYHLVAFAVCCPSGFRPRDKLGLELKDIHGPVPMYGEKLEKSMDRYFANLPMGKMVRRANWTVTTHARLFALEGNHFGAEVGREEVSRLKREVDVAECRLRTERQTLHRLELTGGLCFAFKTYLYELDEVKREGRGDEMAEAIEGMEKGSVPDMAVYKRQVVWGEKVAAYLRE